jgi:DNA replication protein DnaC
MSILATINKLQQMKLCGMAQALKSASEIGFSGLGTDELLAHLVDSEWEERHTRRLERLLKDAKFRYQASAGEIDFCLSRNLSKEAFLTFSDTTWIERKKNIIITGPTGVGKSFLASALGNDACIHGHATLYYNVQKLFSSLKLKKADGSYAQEIKKIAKAKLIILDDFGLEKLDSASRLALLEILEDRHGLASTIITSQLPVSAWHEVIGDPTIADAICDRIVSSSYRIELNGGSVRMKFKLD